MLTAARELLRGSGAKRARAASAELRDAAAAAAQHADDERIATALQRISMDGETRARLRAVLRARPGSAGAAAGGAADAAALGGGGAGGSARSSAARGAGQQQTRGALLSLRGIMQEVVHKAGLVGAAAKEERPFLQKLRATQMFVQLERWERVHNACRRRPAARDARGAASGDGAPPPPDASLKNPPLAMRSGMRIAADSPALWRVDSDKGGDRGGALAVAAGGEGGSGSGWCVEGAGARDNRRPKSWIAQTLSAVTQRRPASQRSALDAQIGRELDGLAALKQSAAVAFEDGQLSIEEYDHIIGVRTTAFVEWLGRVDDERVEY